jgi:ferric-dicitrate binding protein FerR (iron transport regulator)
MSRNDLNDSTLWRLRTAADWVQRLHQSPGNELLCDRCQRWLDASPENAKAFERMEIVWQAIGQLATISWAATEISEIAAPAAGMSGLASQCASRELQAARQASQSAGRRCVAATLAPVKQQLPRPTRISRPPAQA